VRSLERDLRTSLLNGLTDILDNTSLNIKKIASDFNTNNLDSLDKAINNLIINFKSSELAKD
jgi:hypothetical protein